MFDFEGKAREYREYKRMSEEMETIASGIADEIKAAMISAGKNKLIAGQYKISYIDARNSHLDQQKLKASLGDLTPYMTTSTYKRFCVA